jgi:two-component system, chemotaxis family, CheB/CheR fusion protein
VDDEQQQVGDDGLAPDGAADAVGGEADDAGFDDLLAFLNRTRAFDFRGYKPASLGRRIRRRMQMVGVKTFAEYTDYLQVHPDEHAQLFDMVLINVTAFFRDPAAWEALDVCLGKLIESSPPDRPLRAWSAGCASGEEAYTIAILLAERLGLEAFTQRVKIYATDFDEDALARARAATYPAKSLEALPPALVEKYFQPTPSGFVVHKDLRRCVIFGRHDLLHDAPISKVDLLVCRNTLMYFNADAQEHILRRLHFAVGDRGILFLGKAEMLLTHGYLFTPIDLKLRIFQRTPRERRDGREVRDARFDPEGGDGAKGPPRDLSNDARERLKRAAFDSVPIGIVLLDMAGRIVHITRRATELLGVLPSDLGRMFHELELSYRPVDLRSAIDRAREERRVVAVPSVERRTKAGERIVFEVTVAPILSGAEPTGVQLCFHDITRTEHLQAELQKTYVALSAAHEELQSTSEELETTNEELQSTVEELETTNEELQSTNEELETMNEELQSTNEELQTMNEELRLRGDDLKHVNGFLNAILGGMRSGIAVLDRDLKVEAWNHKMEDLWGVHSGEVLGKQLLTLDIGLPLDELAPAIRACVLNEAHDTREVTCMNRRGKNVRCRVTVGPMGSESRGVILAVEEL